MLAGMSSRHSGDSGGCPEDHRRVAVELMAAARALRVSIWSRTSEAICVAIAREGSSGSDVGRPPSLRGPMAYAAFRPGFEGFFSSEGASPRAHASDSRGAAESEEPAEGAEETAEAPSRHRPLLRAGQSGFCGARSRIAGW